MSDLTERLHGHADTFTVYTDTDKVVTDLRAAADRIEELETAIRDCTDDGLDAALLRKIVAANPDLGETTLTSLQHCAESFEELYGLLPLITTEKP